MTKKITAVFLAALFALLSLTCAAGAEEAKKTFTDASQTCAFVVMGKDFTVPLRVVPAELTVNGERRDVYFIAMLGVKSNNAQVNSGKSLFQAAFGFSNPYYELTKSVLLENVPEGAALVFACHSLGGMVAQRLRTDAELKDRYEILHVLTCGSPLILVKEADAEGTLIRLADTGDAVPFLSPATLCCLSRQLKTACREDGGYALDPDGAHNLSYLRQDVWGEYDALGLKGGDAALSFDPAAVVEYGAE